MQTKEARLSPIIKDGDRYHKIPKKKLISDEPYIIERIKKFFGLEYNELSEFSVKNKRYIITRDFEGIGLDNVNGFIDNEIKIKFAKLVLFRRYFPVKTILKNILIIEKDDNYTFKTYPEYFTEDSSTLMNSNKANIMFSTFDSQIVKEQLYILIGADNEEQFPFKLIEFCHKLYKIIGNANYSWLVDYFKQKIISDY